VAGSRYVETGELQIKYFNLTLWLLQPIKQSEFIIENNAMGLRCSPWQKIVGQT